MYRACLHSDPSKDSLTENADSSGWRRYLNRTAVDPALPPCAAQALHNLHREDWETWGRGPSSSKDDSSSASSPSGAGVGILAALLPVGALLAAGVMGQRLWHRKQRRAGDGGLQLSQRHREDLHSLLPQPGNGVPASTGRSALGSMARRGKRSRLAALLQQVIGDQREGLMMVPMAKLPTALAHQLGSVRKAAASRQTRSSRAAAAADGGMLPHELAAAVSAFSGTADTSDASSWSSRDLELAVLDPLAAAQSSGDSSNSPSGSRHWGLQTTSLQVPLGALTVSGIGWLGGGVRTALFGQNTHAPAAPVP
jgi:hypothetical protein